MTGLSTDSVAWLSLICMVVGAKAVVYCLNRRAEKKRTNERNALLESLRGKAEKEMTFDEAVACQIDLYEKLAPRGTDTSEQRSAIWARLTLEYELGRYADKPTCTSLDASQHDILVAGARQDAAEALANTRALLQTVRQLTKRSNDLESLIFWIGLVFISYQFLKTGIAP